MEFFEEYPAPERSKLERHSELIRELRSKNWPFHAIRRHLASRHELQITVQGIHKFCRTRSIPKGHGPPGPAASAQPQPSASVFPPASFPAAHSAPPPPDPPSAASPIPPSGPRPRSSGKAMTRKEIDALKAKTAREVAEADAAGAARKAKWNFAATEAEIFRATTPGYENK